MATSTRVVSSVFRKDLFKNKVAIVSGGGTGIGKCITKELLFLGSNVMIASRKADSLEKAAQEIRMWQQEIQNEARLEWTTCNIRQEEEVQNLISLTLKTFGKLDFLVNNGGGQYLSTTGDMKLKGWKAVVDTNLTGTFLMCREAFQQWMKDNGGSIVNIIANMFNGMPTMSHSGAARAGVDNLTKSLSIEWAGNGVRINSVAPGSSIYSETAAANYGDPEIFEIRKSSIPYHRLGTVEEISAAVCFLLCPAASFITGETMKVDAGESLYSSLIKIPAHSRMPAYTWEKDAKDKEQGHKDTTKKSKL